MPYIKRRSTPRRGRVVDEKYMDWLATEPCDVHPFGGCRTPLTIHHVRFCGSPKDDTRTLHLCAEAHLHDWGPHSVERGKEQFEIYWRVDIENLISNHHRKYYMVT